MKKMMHLSAVEGSVVVVVVEGDPVFLLHIKVGKKQVII